MEIKTKAKRSIIPTIRQKNAFEQVIQNGGNVSKSMREAGYSPESAKNPSKLTKSQAWQVMLDEIEDKPLLEKLQEIGLGEDKRACISAIDTLFKLKDKYPKQKIDGELDAIRKQVTITDNRGNKVDAVTEKIKIHKSRKEVEKQ